MTVVGFSVVVVVVKRKQRSKSQERFESNAISVPAYTCNPEPFVK